MSYYRLGVEPTVENREDLHRLWQHSCLHRCSLVFSLLSSDYASVDRRNTTTCRRYDVLDEMIS